MRFHIWILVIALGVLAGCPSPKTPPQAPVSQAGESAEQSDPYHDAVTALVQPLIDDEWLVGVSVAVIADNKVHFYGFGRTALTGGTVPDADTVFEIGSTSKVLTALLLADAIEQNQLTLDTPVESLLPAGVTLPRKGNVAITVAHLASHTSGLLRMPTNFAPKNINNPYADYTFDQLHAYLSKAELTHTPGTKYAYSNLGAGLLGHVLGLRANTSYEALTKQRILEPLGMTNTDTTLTGVMRARLAHGHTSEGEPAANWDFPTLAGAGGWRSTARDMAAFIQANINLAHPILASAMASTHTSRHKIAGGDEQVGLGWHISKGGYRWHNGQTGGYHSFFGFHHDLKHGVVVLANSGGPIVDVLGRALGLMLAGKKHELKLPKVAKVAPEVLKRYVGKYQLAPGLLVVITVEGHKLFAQATAQPRYRIYPESDTRFAWRVVTAALEFQLDSDGEVTGATLFQGGQEITGEKVE